jgi:GT2 family glycosyltransferase
MDLRISIVNYNTCALLDKCLSSIAAHPPDGPYEVVVVDNASRDDSVAMVRERHPAVQVIASPDNLGYAAGNNLAMRGSRARYFLVLNSDIEVHPGCLQRQIEFMDAHPAIGMVGCRLILPDGSVQPSCATRLTLRKYLTQQLLLDKAGLAHRLFGEYWIDCAAATEPMPVEQATGAAMFCRREALQQVGPMDEGYWMYCEDSDWCERFQTAGWPIWYLPSATMDHKLGGSSSTARAEMIAAYNLAAARFFRIHHGGCQGFIARGLGMMGAAMRLMLWTGLAAATVGRSERYRQQVMLFAKTLWLIASPQR